MSLPLRTILRRGALESRQRVRELDRTRDIRWLFEHEPEEQENAILVACQGEVLVLARRGGR